MKVGHEHPAVPGKLVAVRSPVSSTSPPFRKSLFLAVGMLVPATATGGLRLKPEEIPLSETPDADKAEAKRRARARWWAANRDRVNALRKAQRAADPEGWRIARKRWREANSDKVRAYGRAAYHAANPDKVKAKRAARYAADREKEQAYRAANADKIKARTAAWRTANADKIKALAAARYAANVDKIKARKHAYYLANRERLLADQKARKAEAAIRAGRPPGWIGRPPKGTPR